MNKLHFESYDVALQEKWKVTLLLLENFQRLAAVAQESGGSVSFEWTLRNGGRELDEIIRKGRPTPNLCMLSFGLWYGSGYRW